MKLLFNNNINICCYFKYLFKWFFLCFIILTQFIILLLCRQWRTTENTAPLGPFDDHTRDHAEKGCQRTEKGHHEIEKFGGPTTSSPSVDPHTEVDIETRISGNFWNSQTLYSVVRAAVGLEVDGVRSGSWTDARHSHLYRSVGSRSHLPVQ